MGEARIYLACLSAARLLACSPLPNKTRTGCLKAHLRARADRCGEGAVRSAASHAASCTKVHQVATKPEHGSFSSFNRVQMRTAKAAAAAAAATLPLALNPRLCDLEPSQKQGN